MKKIYTQSQTTKIDTIAAEYLQLNSFQLMQKAAQSIFEYIKNHKQIIVVAGAGNNAGDGYIIANLALKHNINVCVWGLMAIEDLPYDAQMAAKQYIHNGGEMINQPPAKQFDCIVDALFGTGLNRDISGLFLHAIKWINAKKATTISVDIPSGLDTDTGSIKGICVKADLTIAVICLKIGHLTNNGQEQCGQLFLEDLDIPEQVFDEVLSPIYRLDKSVFDNSKLQHTSNSHKGMFGHVVAVGGQDGMLGALILTGRSALRSGCGAVELISQSQHINAVTVNNPELMTSNSLKESRLIHTTQTIAIGPGLGTSQEARNLLETSLNLNKFLVLDADALNLLSNMTRFKHNAILTPHPKEAAKLLNTDINTIQSDRVTAAIKISQNFQAIVILKGSGTIVSDPQGNVFICPFGYAGMATAGMGDVLTGIVAGLMAQGLSAIDAAIIGVAWHAISADECCKGNGLIASDVIEKMPNIL